MSGTLKKELTLTSLILYGVGIILGAGVYALIGAGAGLAGNMLWLAFLLGAVIATFTGLSYAELAGMFQKEAAEYVYTKKAFRKEWLSFLVGWVLIGASIISAAVVALAFGGYLSYLIGGDTVIFAVLLIGILSILNYIGIKESAFFNNFASIIEAGGLLLVVGIGLLFGGNTSVDYFELPPLEFAGIISAISVIYFAFIGFENIANISEEAKDGRRIVPKAIIISLAISSFLYMLLSFAVLQLISWEELASSPAPLTAAVERAVPAFGIVISIIALFATSNTVLIILISASRILYGISSQGSLPALYSAISKRGTPYVAIIFAGIAAALAAMYGDIKAVAQLTDLGIFIAYFFVNIALIQLRISGKTGSTFRSPSIGNIPVLAVIGAVSSLFMLLYFEVSTWIIQLGIIFAGAAVFIAYIKRRKK